MDPLSNTLGRLKKSSRNTINQNRKTNCSNALHDHLNPIESKIHMSENFMEKIPIHLIIGIMHI